MPLIWIWKLRKQKVLGRENLIHCSHSKERDLGERKSKREDKNQRENPCTNSKKHEEKEGHDFLDNCTSIMTQIPMQLLNN